MNRAKSALAIRIAFDCPKCSGRLRLIAFITGEGPPAAKAARPGDDAPEAAPEYDQVDPTWSD